MNPALAFFKANLNKYASESSPSPLGRWLNGKLIAAEEDSLTVEFLVRNDMTNPAKILHGGATAAMLDDVIGMTVFALGRETLFTTINLNIDYLTPAREGDTILVQAKVIRAGKSIVNMYCEARKQDETLIAKASANMASTGIKL